jgi:hypothetical protein
VIVTVDVPLVTAISTDTEAGMARGAARLRMAARAAGPAANIMFIVPLVTMVLDTGSEMRYAQGYADAVNVSEMLLVAWK